MEAKKVLCPFQAAHEHRNNDRAEGRKVMEAVKPYLFDKQGNEYVAKANPDKGAAIAAAKATGVDMDGVVAGLRHTTDKKSATICCFVKDVKEMVDGKDMPSTVSNMATYLNVAQRKAPALVVG